MQFRRQIDHHVAAGDQIESGKRGVFDETVARKEHHLPQRGFYLVSAGLLEKEVLQPHGTHVFRNAIGVKAFAGRL